MYQKNSQIHLFINWTCGEAIYGENVRDATENEFPFVVSLISVSNEIEPPALVLRQFCTGSLITTKHVLTAEHCLVTKKVYEVEVLVGSTSLDKCKAYDPEEWITYQQWKHNSSNMFPIYYHDVAVITLKMCVFESNMIPAALSKSKPKKLFGKNVKLAGWGWTTDAVKPEILRVVDLKVLSNADCQSKLSQIVKTNFPLVYWHLCAISEPWAFNACGDSGGPLINNKKKIIGITIGTCPRVNTLSDLQVAKRFLDDRMNIYVNLYYYQDFLRQYTNDNHRCSVMK